MWEGEQAKPRLIRVLRMIRELKKMTTMLLMRTRTTAKPLNRKDPARHQSQVHTRIRLGEADGKDSIGGRAERVWQGLRDFRSMFLRI